MMILFQILMMSTKLTILVETIVCIVSKQSPYNMVSPVEYVENQKVLKCIDRIIIFMHLYRFIYIDPSCNFNSVNMHFLWYNLGPVLNNV